MSQELTPQNNKPARLDKSIATAEEVATNILTVFKSSVKRAGGFKDDEYQLSYGNAEANIKMWLHHLLELAATEERS